MATLDTYALTSLANVREYIGTTPAYSDSLLCAAVNRASDVIEAELGRQVLSRSYSELYDGEGDAEIFLAQRPVTRVARVGVGRDPSHRVKNTSTDAYRATVECSATVLRLIVTGGTNADDTSLTLASYTTAATLTTAINAIGKGWTAETVSYTYPKAAADVLPFPATYALGGVQVDLEVPRDQYQTTWGYNSYGVLRARDGACWPCGHQNIYVEYTAGWATVPDDIEEVCIQLVKAMLDAQDHDFTIQSESLGDYSYSLGTEAFRAKFLSDEMRRKLEPYMSRTSTTGVTA